MSENENQIDNIKKTLEIIEMDLWQAQNAVSKITENLLKIAGEIERITKINEEVKTNGI